MSGSEKGATTFARREDDVRKIVEQFGITEGLLHPPSTSSKTGNKPIPKPNCTLDQDVIDRLGLWMQEMREWCQRARLDIIRLEGNAGFCHGDPGDPPREPWGTEEE